MIFDAQAVELTPVSDGLHSVATGYWPLHASALRRMLDKQPLRYGELTGSTFSLGEVGWRPTCPHSHCMVLDRLGSCVAFAAAGWTNFGGNASQGLNLSYASEAAAEGKGLARAAASMVLLLAISRGGIAPCECVVHAQVRASNRRALNLALALGLRPEA